jgi:hypothetical protein
MKNLKGLFSLGLVASLAVVLGATPALAQTCSPITSGEVARWKGDGNALDSIGSNHGTLQNGTTFGPALFGQGFVVDGVDDYVSVPDSPALSFTSAFTLAAWVNPTAPNNGVIQGVVAKSRPGGGTGYRMAVESGKVAIGINNNGVNCLLTSSTSVAAGQWSLITVSFGSGSLKAYLNGALFGTASCPFSSLQDSTEPLLIGRELTFLNRFFTGTIDQVRVFNRVLTDPEVNNLYDFDCDTFPDHLDNCPSDVNPDQADGDGDNIGDVCDNDHDNDSVVDASDNCPLVANADQADNDLDTLGDACDDDDDNDGIADTADNCPFTANVDQADFDHDGLGNVCDADPDGDGVLAGDNCPLVPNVDQADADNDGSGDACDADDDNDGVLDAADNCPVNANPDQADQDGDNIGDVCDADIDGDGVLNGDDNCSLVANPGQDNADGDADGDACDLDDDNDGVLDGGDNCPLIVNPGQQDADHDGIGDACDGDLDGDGVANGVDNCPVTPNGDQLDFDADGQGDACDNDIDGDGVLNGADICAFTPSGEPVDAATGCSIAQLCPCAGPRGTTQPWKNHGQYVSCVAKSSQSFVKQGLITSMERDAIVSAAGNSSCGK